MPDRLAHIPSDSARIRFGAGLLNTLPEETRRLGVERVLVVSTPGRGAAATDVLTCLGGTGAGQFNGARMHVPVEVTEQALACLTELRADCILSVGGGSATGLGKALALRTGLPLIAMPTTFAGSEASPILGQSENGKKTTLSDPRAKPKVLLYDLELAQTLPPEVAAASGMNAIAHATEALYAADRTAHTTEVAIEGLFALVHGVPAVVEATGDFEALELAMQGAWACGALTAMVEMGLHHKLCQVIGGAFRMPHAQTHAVILPYVVAYNALSSKVLLGPVHDVMGGASAAQGVYDFARSLNLPRSLRELGMSEADLDRAADLAMERPFPNPTPVDRDGIRSLLQMAWVGRLPGG